jgi:hypothetical protein
MVETVRAGPSFCKQLQDRALEGFWPAIRLLRVVGIDFESACAVGILLWHGLGRAGSLLQHLARPLFSGPCRKPCDYESSLGRTIVSLGEAKPG